MRTVSRLFLVDDNINGMRTYEVQNTTIKATAFPRTLLKDFSVRPEAEKPGVYLLYGEVDDSSESMLYIGEGDPVIERLKQHNSHKDFWTEAYVFSSKDEYLTKTQIQFLESRLISIAKEAKRIKLDNMQSSSEPTISEVERAEAEDFLKLINIINNAMNLQFFIPLAQPSILPRSSELIYEYNIKNYHAKMVVRNGKYVVLAGSTAAKNNLPSTKPALCKFRDSLIQSEALTDSGDKRLTVAKDILCDSPSYAASVISGGHVNGWKAWKINGQSLKEHNKHMI